MKEQNHKNHAQYVPGFHFITAAAIIALLIGSIVNLYNSLYDHANLYSASLICLAAIILCLLFWYIRSFPLRAQDRAIRAEENFRHFVLTGRRLDNRLTLSQIIALRFAPDEEMPMLAQRAAEENLSSKDIKNSITNWKPDHHRV
ncbi:hypothetical protein FRZ67_03730 [Panacibacter ginsenosidivorans]|uniref:Uncharacterized protein n=1 Tax=Panacibacter ginsenosidivorans TaxID=1813871 RepID=A0A5B8V5T7_9BACT|nr:DUF6526 family protein [Panacibacter ginsenosidivorans]QEC66445.1 hypothetical protein FRZ67_03730 [Panacibacter ginsenosidivorans]